MKTALSYQLKAFSQSSIPQNVGCALRTIPFFRNHPARRFPPCLVSRGRHS
jgi:hypothetical protein